MPDVPKLNLDIRGFWIRCSMIVCFLKIPKLAFFNFFFQVHPLLAKLKLYQTEKYYYKISLYNKFLSCIIVERFISSPLNGVELLHSEDFYKGGGADHELDKDIGS